MFLVSNVYLHFSKIDFFSFRSPHIQMLFFNLYLRQRDRLAKKIFTSESFVFNIERGLGCLTNTATLTLNSLKLSNSIFSQI